MTRMVTIASLTALAVLGAACTNDYGYDRPYYGYSQGYATPGYGYYAPARYPAAADSAVTTAAPRTPPGPAACPWPGSAAAS